MKRILKSRWFLGALCIAVSVIIMIAYTNSISAANKNIKVVTVVNAISKNDIISKADIEMLEVSAYNLSPDFVTDSAEVIGKYANADLYSGDYILKGKTSDSIQSSNEKLSQLDGTKIAISITIKAFANGLSDKIMSGDIVSCIVTQEEATMIPKELTYVEVLATTTSDGVDKEKPSDASDSNLATATLLVTPHQAALLANYERSAEIHLALSYRGEAEKSAEFLKKQSEVLANVENNSNNGE